MGGRNTPPMWVLVILVLIAPINAICPARCQCNDHSLEVICQEGNLEVFPIQLNPEVRHLDLSKNAIYTIYYTLNFYSNLIYLDISHNKLTSLGALNYISQQNLKYLNVSWNQLDSITKDTFKGLTALLDLNLSYNYIDDIPSHVFRDLHSLESLHLTGNQLIYLEEGVFKSLNQLKRLYLDKNQFLEIPGAALNGVHTLKYLSLSQNLLESLGEDMPLSLSELNVLLLDHNLISHIESGSLSRLVSLTHLDISDNNFTSIPTQSLAKLSNLTNFRFSGNFINSIPSVAFRGLFHLKILFLDRLEFLTHIDSRAFVDNINLERVQLDNNIVLDSLPTRLFYGSHKMAHVSIRNNQLTTLDASHFPIDQLHSLKLGGNPWECNCTLLWLWRLAREQGIINQNDSEIRLDIDIESILCRGPIPVNGMLLMNIRESVVSCSLSWISTVSAICFACILLALAMSLIYCGILKMRRNLPKEPIPCCSGGAALTLSYDDAHRLTPRIIQDYQTLSPWTPSIKNSNDMYRQFESGNIHLRPHIVYV